jgi:hypothetical protein
MCELNNLSQITLVSISNQQTSEYYFVSTSPKAIIENAFDQIVAKCNGYVRSYSAPFLNRNNTGISEC